MRVTIEMPDEEIMKVVYRKMKDDLISALVVRSGLEAEYKATSLDGESMAEWFRRCDASSRQSESGL